MVVEKLKEREDARDNKRDEEHNPDTGLKLRELREGTIIKYGDHLLTFLGIDGMYARRRIPTGKVIIMGGANQEVSEYGEIVKN